MLMATTVQKEVGEGLRPLCHLHGFPIYLTEPIICAVSHRCVGELQRAVGCNSAI